MSETKFRQIESLPVDLAGYGDIRTIFDGHDLIIEFEYCADGRDHIGRVCFTWVTAFRFRDESHTFGSPDTDAYEPAVAAASFQAVIEIPESEWEYALSRSARAHVVKPPGGSHHYAVFLKDFGYVEVIASSAKVTNGA